ncbi:MAG: phosphoribosylanthranilate isomerase [Bacteroidetes bacterium]|nr:phosphoribosylanthranilate isomerase [Bacteroidota bacterium]
MIIKVCGLTNEENMQALEKLGIDYFGFIFYPESPRNVEPGMLNPDFVKGLKQKKVGVFVNAELNFILKVIFVFNFDFVQLHGNEKPGFCVQLKKYLPDDVGIIKAFGINASFNFDLLNEYESTCDYFLFDTKVKYYGGSGQQFDWTILNNYKGKTPFLLSGGIDMHSAEAIKALDLEKMAGVDLNSRFEVEAGMKDEIKISRFLKQIE